MSGKSKCNYSSIQARRIKNWLLISVIAITFFFPGLDIATADFEQIKRVLVLYSLEKGNEGQDMVDAKLRGIFSRNRAFNIQVYNEYLDLIRFPWQESISATSSYLRHKYSSEKPDVVVTILPPALDFLEQNENGLFKGIPIVAAFLPRDRAESFANSPMRKLTTCIVYADNAYEIAQSALRLKTRTKNVAFISGTSDLDISFKAPILREIKRAARDMKVIDLSGLPLGEILSRVHDIPPDTIVFNTTVFRDGAGHTFSPPDVLRLVSDASKAPVFGFTDIFMGKGIVGGKLSSVQWQTEKIAELTKRILEGESPAGMPIAGEDGYRTVYDWHELRRWEIPEASLPKGSILVNKEQGIFDRYKRYIFAGIFALIFQTIFIVFLIDMNKKRKRASSQHREFVDRYHELLRVDRSSRLGELTATLAHELNQPLGAILSNAQAALRFLASGKNDSELTREILENIVQDDKRAADVIRSLRSMVKKGESKREPIDVNEALREVIDITRGALISRNIVVKTLFDEMLPLVTADKTQIQQVALNLVMNGIDAVEQSANVGRKIVLKTELLDGFIRVSVGDNGAGIHAESVDRIFDPFYTTKINGLGMGLAVCKSIIAEHGGRIWAENNHDGVGSTLFFTLRMSGHDR